MRCLRDTVLLLHGLSQKDTLFTVHCVEALHQYDQVMPGVSALIRGLPDVTDCEGELAGGSLPARAHLGTFLKFMDESTFPACSAALHPPRSLPALESFLPSCSGSSLSTSGCLACIC